jgi:ABC-type transporter Mla subunit MlaD
MQVHGLALLMVLAFQSACKRSEDRIVFVDLPRAENPKEGTAVQFRGIDIGRVNKVTLEHSGVRLKLLIQRADAPVELNDRVALRAIGVFGDQVVDIIPSPTEGQAVADRGALRAAPPDSLAPTGDALVRAVVHEFAQRSSKSDSSRPPPPARAPRP